jgi:hypothetical protein
MWHSKNPLSAFDMHSYFKTIRVALMASAALRVWLIYVDLLESQRQNQTDNGVASLL